MENSSDIYSELKRLAILHDKRLFKTLDRILGRHLEGWEKLYIAASLANGELAAFPDVTFTMRILSDKILRDWALGVDIVSLPKYSDN